MHHDSLDKDTNAMLPIQGNPRTLCDGLTRRDLLQVGALGPLGIGLSDVLGAESVSS